jgi:CubicO group peptidase (beta-lactamase class C family)
MQRLTRELEQGVYPNTHIVLVEHGGRLVYEAYLAGADRSWGEPLGHREFDADSLHDLRSVSNSVTALLLGIALGDDYEDALSRPVIEYFPEYAASVPPGVETITLHQVLAMSNGQRWNEMELPYSSRRNDEVRMYYQADPLAYVLGKEMRDLPGESWYYNGGTTMLLAAIVVRLSGMEFLDFAHQALFEPLGIGAQDIEWRGLGIWRQRPRLPSAAPGLRMRARPGEDRFADAARRPLAGAADRTAGLGARIVAAAHRAKLPDLEPARPLRLWLPVVARYIQGRLRRVYRGHRSRLRRPARVRHSREEHRGHDIRRQLRHRQLGCIGNDSAGNHVGGALRSRLSVPARDCVNDFRDENSFPRTGAFQPG